MTPPGRAVAAHQPRNPHAVPRLRASTLASSSSLPGSDSTSSARASSDLQGRDGRGGNKE